MYGPHCLRDLQAPQLCSALIIFGGEDKRKKGDRKKGPGSESRDGPPDFAAAGLGCLDSEG